MNRCPLLFSNTVRTEITRLVNDKKMLIGAFHAYGHGAKCQLLNISRHEGAGLTSGEEAEQVNAMLIPSSASLRKQSLPFFTDSLDCLMAEINLDFFTHFPEKMANMIRNADRQLDKAQQELRKLSEQFYFAEQDVAAWRFQHREIASNTVTRSFQNLRRKFTRAQHVQYEQYELQHWLSVASPSKTISRRIKTLQASIAKLETGNADGRAVEVQSNWLQETLLKEFDDSIRQTLQLASERCLCWSVKRRAVGLAQAKKVIAAAHRASKKMDVRFKRMQVVRTLILALPSHPPLSRLPEVKESQLKKMSSIQEIAAACAFAGSGIQPPSVPFTIQVEAVQCMEKKRRAQEELSILRQELQRCQAALERDISAIDDCIARHQQSLETQDLQQTRLWVVYGSISMLTTEKTKLQHRVKLADYLLKTPSNRVSVPAVLRESQRLLHLGCTDAVGAHDDLEVDSDFLGEDELPDDSPTQDTDIESESSSLPSSSSSDDGENSSVVPDSEPDAAA